MKYLCSLMCTVDWVDMICKTNQGSSYILVQFQIATPSSLHSCFLVKRKYCLLEVHLSIKQFVQFSVWHKIESGERNMLPHPLTTIPVMLLTVQPTPLPYVIFYWPHCGQNCTVVKVSRPETCVPKEPFPSQAALLLWHHGRYEHWDAEHKCFSRRGKAFSKPRIQPVDQSLVSPALIIRWSKELDVKGGPSYLLSNKGLSIFNKFYTRVFSFVKLFHCLNLISYSKWNHCVTLPG